jgi:type III restriction enzyme
MSNDTQITPIRNLIICNPYKSPTEHWKYNRMKRKFERLPGRRPAGFLIASQDSKAFDDPGEFRELKLVNQIRDRVDNWRERGHPNITGVTRQLLNFWQDKTQRENQFFFCQMESIETLIWLVEAPDSEKQGIDIPSDGGNFERLCAKMATGSGKTIVMAMLMAWQIINKITYPQDKRFSKNILIMTPGLTVKSRLAVLNPTSKNNYFQMFRVVPDSFYERLLKGKIVLHNWHTLMPIDDAKYGVVKKGKESDMAFAKRILGFDSKNIIIINDEAHHAWRMTSKAENKISKDEIEQATRWVEGLDKIHNARNIVKCYDFSATPFIPSGKNVSEDMLFEWVISDFSLNDAIESGLTKTPKIAIRDDSGKFDKNYRSRFYHIYRDDEVKPDLNRKAKPEEKLPDLITNAYFLLGQDWIETKKVWDAHYLKTKTSPIPPVMITVCNRTETASRIMYSFEKDRFGLKELSDPRYLLHIDSTSLNKAEEKDSRSDGVGNADERKAELLRQKVDTVGQRGKPGEEIRNIIAVQMLSEGWDARNVTHIMGLRAFSSQLLCEQVVGRGLRRTSYEVNTETGLFEPEYVNVFGVPFTFLPHEGGDDTPPLPSIPTTRIEPDPDKKEYEISWPNIERIETIFTLKLSVDWSKIKSLEIRSDNTSTTVGMAQVLEGKPHVDKMSDIDLNELNKTIRLQKIIFLATKDVYESIGRSWKGNKEFLLAQIVKLVEEFVHSEKIQVIDIVEGQELRKKMTFLFNMQKIVQHIFDAIKDANIEEKKLILNHQHIMKSTGEMQPWSTKKPAEYVIKNHINLSVYDNKWEMSTGQELERNKKVTSWVKIDHLGFVIKYIYNGILHDYWPDFLIKLQNGITLVLEIKGQDDDQNRTKRKFLEEWVDTVNSDGSYGMWAWDVAFNPSDVRTIVEKHAKAEVSSKIFAKCPACNKIAHTGNDIEKQFGFRNSEGITRPQSWCRQCRKSKS